MNRLLLALAATVTVSSGVWHLTDSDTAAQAATLAPTTKAEAPSPTPRDTPLTAVAVETERQPLGTSSPDLEDPCSSVRSELDAAIVACNARDKTIDQLNEKLAAMMRERDRLRFGEDTPYGAFLTSYEADEIRDVNVLIRIEDWLQQFPVFLGTGEATWIAERTLARDWKSYGRTSEVALIRFLGSARLAAELPPERLIELREYYADEDLFN